LLNIVSKYNMIEPVQGSFYKIRYIGGTIYSNCDYETVGTFVCKSKGNKNYIFVRDIPYEEKYWVVYIEPNNVLECRDDIKLDFFDIDAIELYIKKSTTFFTKSINKQAHTCYIEYHKIGEFMHEYYKPETGEGYLEALASWNSRNSGEP